MPRPPEASIPTCRSRRATTSSAPSSAWIASTRRLPGFDRRTLPTMVKTTEDAPLYDPATPAFAPQMRDIYRVMRDVHPVYRDPLDRFYALTRFEDVRASALDWGTFSSASKLENQFLEPSMAS